MKLRSAVKEKQNNFSWYIWHTQRESGNLELICKKIRFSCKTEEKSCTDQVNEHGPKFSCKKCSNYFDSIKIYKSNWDYIWNMKKEPYLNMKFAGTEEQQINLWNNIVREFLLVWNVKLSLTMCMNWTGMRNINTQQCLNVIGVISWPQTKQS